MTQADNVRTTHTTSSYPSQDRQDSTSEIGSNREAPPPIPLSGSGASATIAELDLPVTLDDVHAARERIMPHLHRTPTLDSATLSNRTNTQLSIKCETFQRTGSFKARGALNAVLQLTPEQRARGVAVSYTHLRAHETDSYLV